MEWCRTFLRKWTDEMDERLFLKFLRWCHSGEYGDSRRRIEGHPFVLKNNALVCVSLARTL